MKAIIRFFAKKYIISMLNDVLKKVADKEQYPVVIDKTQKIVALCGAVTKALDDGNITQEETEEIISRAGELF